MTNNRANFPSLQMDELRDIQTEVNKRLGEYKKTNSIIKEDIFHILEMNANVLYYPIEDDEICGFFYQFKDRKFVCINTYIPFEKQIFAAAHELYHVWYSDLTDGELLKDVTLEEMADNGEEISKEDVKANRFGAEFLVPKDVLLNELDLRRIIKDQVDLREIVELMDVFLVPYKTIVRRLHEVGYISLDKLNELLEVPDRSENEGVMLWQKRLKLCKRNNERTNELKLHNMVDLALELYERQLITYEKLAHLLALSNCRPEDFNIIENEAALPSEDDVLKEMEEG